MTTRTTRKEQQATPPQSPSGKDHPEPRTRTGTKRARVDDADDSDVSEDERRARRWKASMRQEPEPLTPAGTLASAAPGRSPRANSSGTPRTTRSNKNARSPVKTPPPRAATPSPAGGTSAKSKSPLTKSPPRKLQREFARTESMFTVASGGAGGRARSRSVARGCADGVDPVRSSSSVTAAEGLCGGLQLDEYYFLDEDLYSRTSTAHCIIRVEKTLFRIHRALLSVIPDLEISPECAWDVDNPLVLPVEGLTVEEFRTFCWVAYLEPKAVETHKPITRTITPEWANGLIHAVALVHKHQEFNGPLIKEWIQQALHVAITSPAAESELYTSAPPTLLANLLDTLVEYGFDEEIRPFEKRWIEALLARKEPCLIALNAAEKNGMYELRGVAYYLQVQALHANKGKFAVEAEENLTAAQRQRIASGYVSIVRWWDEQKRQPPKLPATAPKTQSTHLEGEVSVNRSLICCPWSVHERCTEVWENHWRIAMTSEQVLGCASCDVLGSLSAILMVIKSQKPQNLCWWWGLDELTQFTEDTRKQMMKQFFGGNAN